MKRKRIDLVLTGCAVVLLLANYFGLKEFTLNQQAWDAWRGIPSPVSGLLSGHPHGLRFVIYYPIFLISKWLQMRPDVVFTLVCCASIVYVCNILGSIILKIDGDRNFIYKKTFITIALFLVSFLMNGRLILPYLGYSLIISAYIDWLTLRRWGGTQICAIGFGLALTSLSSGTLTAGMLLVVVSAGIVTIRYWGRLGEIVYLNCSSLGLVALFAIPMLIGLQKNLDYFGGGEAGAIQMLGHGTGGALIGEASAPGPNDFGWFSAAYSVLLALFIFWELHKRTDDSDHRDLIIYAALGVTTLGGLFGISILTMGIVPLLLLLRHRAASCAKLARKIYAHQ